MPAPARRHELSPDKRRQILAGARHVFCRLGYELASVDRVAARAGVGKATVYSHFGDKKALFVAAISEEADALRAELAASLGEVRGAPDAALERFGALLIRVLVSPPFVALYRHATSEAERFPEVGREAFARGPVVIYRAVADWLRRWEAAGALSLADADVAARHLITLCQGDLVLRVHWGVTPRPTPREIRAAVRAAVRAFLAAYAPGGAARARRPARAR